MILKQIYLTDDIFTQSPISQRLHYVRDSQDLVFTYKDPCKRPRMWFRYPEAYLRVTSWDGGVVICDPIDGLDIPELTDCIANFTDYQTQILLASDMSYAPCQGEGVDMTITFKVESAQWMILSIFKTKMSTRPACADDVEKLERLKRDAEYIDEYKPGSGAKSVTRLVLPFGYCLDPNVDYQQTIGCYTFETRAALQSVVFKLR